jgi:hypothetical protein
MTYLALQSVALSWTIRHLYAQHFYLLHLSLLSRHQTPLKVTRLTLPKTLFQNLAVVEGFWGSCDSSHPLRCRNVAKRPRSGPSLRSHIKKDWIAVTNVRFSCCPFWFSGAAKVRSPPIASIPVTPTRSAQSGVKEQTLRFGENYFHRPENGPMDKLTLTRWT